MTRPIQEDLVQELAPDYEFVSELGRGGVSVVYLARERELGREVAIKVIRDLYTRDGEAVARFEREARMLARLQHPNIVTLYTARRLSEGALALVMQYGPWKTLKAVITEQGPLPVDAAEGVLRDIAGALGYLHRHNVIHRDIKPENIFVDQETGRALLSDFGLAKPGGVAQENVTLAGVVIGTPAYMSPEQIDGGTLDHLSDVYSLGMVGYEMLTGRRPWEGESLYNVIYKQKNERLPALQEVRPELPPQLCEVIHRAIEKEREIRLESTEALLAGLSSGPRPMQLAAGRSLAPAAYAPAPVPTAELEAIAASLEGAPQPRRSSLRRRSMVTAALVLVLLGGAGAAAVALSTRPAEPQADDLAHAATTDDGAADRLESVPTLPVVSSVPDSARPATAEPAGAEPAPEQQPDQPVQERDVPQEEAREPAARVRESTPPRPAPAASTAAREVEAAAEASRDSQLAVLSRRLPLGINPSPAAPSPADRQTGSAPVLDRVRVDPKVEAPRLRNPATVNQAMLSNYPPRLRQLGIGGLVEVSVLVGPTGVVLETKLATSSGDPQLDQAALKVAQKMDFYPGTMHGLPSAIWAKIPLLFQAQREEEN